jgi:hypothetical protein
VAAIDIARREFSLLGFQRDKVVIASRCADVSAAVTGYVIPFIPFRLKSSPPVPPLPPLPFPTALPPAPPLFRLLS